LVSVLIDSHVHLQPQGERPTVDRARIELYVEHAHRNGVDVVVFTEHLFRFREAFDLLAGWWDSDPRPDLAAITRAYWLDHVNLSLPEYVRLVEEAKSDGLPVRLGLEMDWIPGHADDLRRLLAPYGWDCVLGSVHWLGAFGIDIDECLDEWHRRDVAAVWDEYADFMEDLADSRLADVLAHPDVVKMWGLRPPDESGLHRRLVAAAARNGIAPRSTQRPAQAGGEMYPDPRILRAAHSAGVPITLASMPTIQSELEAGSRRRRRSPARRATEITWRSRAVVRAASRCLRANPA
jgi:histidinol-phosphatase (PHP family)